eukprot:1266696-Prymnesium_polylepis.2
MGPMRRTRRTASTAPMACCSGHCTATGRSRCVCMHSPGVKTRRRRGGNPRISRALPSVAEPPFRPMAISEAVPPLRPVAISEAEPLPWPGSRCDAPSCTRAPPAAAPPTDAP